MKNKSFLFIVISLLFILLYSLRLLKYSYVRTLTGFSNEYYDVVFRVFVSNYWIKFLVLLIFICFLLRDNLNKFSYYTIGSFALFLFFFVLPYF